MSVYQTARDMSAGMLTYIQDWLLHPVQMFQNGFGTETTTTVTVTVTETAAAQQTSSLWPREFLGVPPQLIHELSPHWMMTFIEGLVNFLGSLGTVDLVWHLFVVLVVILLVLFRRPLVPILLHVWEELREDVEALMRRQFFLPCKEIPSTSEELPPKTILVSAADVEELNSSADAIQQRMNHLRMSRINFVRSRTGIVYDLKSSRILQAQLIKAREALEKEKAKPKVNFVRGRAGIVFISRLHKKLTAALEKEKASHQDTQDFLDHQTNARADAEDEVETLRARLETERSELDENAQLEDIPEEDGAAATQVERLENQLQVEQANYSHVFKMKEILRHGGLKLKKELEDLQADYNVLEDDRDTCKETLEALKEQTDVKAVKALRAKMTDDKEDFERRIADLEARLELEQNSREEAQQVSQDLLSHQEELQERLEMAISAYDGLEAATVDLGSLHDPAHVAGEEPVYVRFDDDEEVKKLKAEQARLDAEVEEMERVHEEEMNTRRGAVAEGESWQIYQFAYQQTQGTTTQEGAPLRRTQSAPLWLPPPHHGDTFDPLYDVSDYGDDNRDSEDRDQSRVEEDQNDRVGERGSGNDGGDGAGEEDNGDDDDLDDSRNGGADKVPTDASLAEEHHTTDSLAQPPKSEPSPPSNMNASASEFIPSVRSGQSLIPLPSMNSPSPKTAGPGQAKNPHTQKLNEEVERREWRRMRGMPISAEDEEGDVLPDDILDDMFDRQVAQFQRFTPTPVPRGSMWGALSGIPDLLERKSIPSTPSSSVPEEDEMPMALPSNYWAGIEGAKKTFDEEVGDAIAEVVRGSKGKSLGESMWAPKAAEDTAPPVGQGQANNEPNPEAARDGQPAMRGSSNYWAGIENDKKTFDEEVGDALADIVRECGTKSLADSMWADKPDVKTRAAPQQAASARAEGVASQRTPTRSDDGAVTRAPPRGPPSFTDLPKPQPPPGAPTGPRGHASRAPRQVETPVGSNDPRSTTVPHVPTSPSSHAAPILPAQNDFNVLSASWRIASSTPVAEPVTPVARNGNRSHGFSSRARGRGRSGRGTPTSTGPKSGNAATDSFWRWQEKMAAEGATKKQE